MFDMIARIAAVAFIPATYAVQIVIAKHFGVKPAERYEPAAARMMRVTVMILPLPYIIGANRPVSWMPIWIRTLGFVLIAAGLYVIGRAQYELGHSFVSGVGLHKRHKLVTTGPYSKVRHPLYAGMALTWMGAALLSSELLFSVGALAMIVALMLRIPHEEMLLAEKFRKEHDAYRLNTGWLIPPLRHNSGPAKEALVSQQTIAPSARPKPSNRSKKKRNSKRRRP